jgi:hypothetical protein
MMIDHYHDTGVHAQTTQGPLVNPFIFAVAYGGLLITVHDLPRRVAAAGLVLFARARAKPIPGQVEWDKSSRRGRKSADEMLRMGSGFEFSSLLRRMV